MANQEQEKIFATPVANKELGSRLLKECLSISVNKTNT